MALRVRGRHQNIIIIKKNDNDKENPIYGKKKLGTTESSPVKQIQKKIQMNKKIHEMWNWSIKFFVSAEKYFRLPFYNLKKKKRCHLFFVLPWWNKLVFGAGGGFDNLYWIHLKSKLVDIVPLFVKVFHQHFFFPSSFYPTHSPIPPHNGEGSFFRNTKNEKDNVNT